MRAKLKASVSSRETDEADKREPEVLLEPLFARPSHNRSRNNAIRAHQRCRHAACEAVGDFIEIRDRKKGRISNPRELERLRRRASRLVTMARMPVFRVKLAVH